MVAIQVVSCLLRLKAQSQSQYRDHVGSQNHYDCLETVRRPVRMIRMHSRTASSQTLVSWTHMSSICVVLALNIGKSVGSLF